MQIMNVKVPDHWNLFLIGDNHTGTIMQHLKGWNTMCDMVNSEFDGVNMNAVVHHGDIIEGITFDDPRFDMYEHKEKPWEQMKTFVEQCDPIYHRLIAIGDGNHTRKLHAHGDLAREAVIRLQELKGARTIYGTWTFKIHWKAKDGTSMFKSFHTHGRQQITSTADNPIRREANMEIILQRQLKAKAADCIIMAKGHSHKLLIARPRQELFLYDVLKDIRHDYTSYEQNQRYIHPHARFYVSTGSFLKLYHFLGHSGYAERAEYDPIELGFAVVKIRDRKIQSVEKVVL